MCSFVWINCFLPFLLHSLSSSLYQGSVASVCCQKQHITAFWPMSWLLSWFPFVFSVLHTLPALVSCFLLPVGFFFSLILSPSLKIYHAVLIHLNMQKFGFFRIFVVIKGWQRLQFQSASVSICDLLLAFVQHPDCTICLRELSCVVPGSP